MGKAQGPAMDIGLNDREVDIETIVNNSEGEGPDMGFKLNDLTADIEEGVKSFSLCDEEKKWTATSIYKVPSFIRDIRKDIFTPTVVSFGPYHHNAHNLRPVEEHKRRALVHFLRMASKPLDHFIEAMRAIEKQLQDSTIASTRMLRMKDEKCRAKRLPYIRRDMLVMENQLPLLVLKKLLEVEGLQSDVDDVSINKMVLRFFEVEKYIPITGLGLHPLDVYRKSLLHGTPQRTPPRAARNQSSNEVIRPAVELHEAGIKFKKGESLADIDFRKGVLTLPFLQVDDDTESMLLNLVAFEHLHVGTGSEVISYVCFMDEVIDSAKDVRLLHGKGIIRNASGSDKSVAELFGRLSKEVTLGPERRLQDVRRLVNEHCGARWNTWKADLRHNISIPHGPRSHS
ncbi:UPF0481 protein At3g47200-like [Phoenix dactylifera]|uniref:UPF0481 protein At3g47200-like n=1 Tax=Phoenix dactylifera TaxID=42345 RepID=A0A8B9A155_PHODC|nr:UPF0481 protein At3g47200-like [Phoenix dactylifera]